MYSQGKDIASEVTALNALAVTAATAGGSNDNAAVNGLSIDLKRTADRYNALAFLVGLESTLAASQSAALTAKVQTSGDGSTWTDLVASAALGTLTATGRGVYELHVPVDRALRYVRLVPTVNLSASGTDTASMYAFALARTATGI